MQESTRDGVLPGLALALASLIGLALLLGGCGRQAVSPPPLTLASCALVIGPTGPLRGRASCTMLVAKLDQAYPFRGLHFSREPYITPVNVNRHFFWHESQRSITFTEYGADGKPTRANGNLVAFLAVVYPLPNAARRK